MDLILTSNGYELDEESEQEAREFAIARTLSIHIQEFENFFEQSKRRLLRQKLSEFKIGRRWNKK